MKKLKKTGFLHFSHFRARFEESVEDDGLYNGKYASNNDWEFLAETSEAFFSAEEWRYGREDELGNDAFPYRQNCKHFLRISKKNIDSRKEKITEI